MLKLAGIRRIVPTDCENVNLIVHATATNGGALIRLSNLSILFRLLADIQDAYAAGCRSDLQLTINHNQYTLTFEQWGDVYCVGEDWIVNSTKQ